jgi:hypothetical protein
MCKLQICKNLKNNRVPENSEKKKGEEVNQVQGIRFRVLDSDYRVSLEY